MPFSNSDHNSLIVCIILSLDDTPSSDPESFFDWSGADWQLYAEYCSSIDWQHVFLDCHCANDYWSVFMEILNHGNEQFVPQKISKIMK